MKVRWKRRGQRTVAFLAVFGSLLATATPSAAEPDWSDSRLAAMKPEKWNPEATVPELTLPGTGAKVKPFSDPGPMGPTALPGFENLRFSTLYSADKATDAAPAEEEYYCRTVMGGRHAVREEATEPDQPSFQYLQIDYLGEVYCNVTMVYLGGMAGVIDRTQGYNGRTLHSGRPFAITDWHQASSTGSVEIPGDATDGARRAEIAFDLFLQAPGGLKWGNCAPGPGQRILFCSGVGTSNLHVQLGLGVFDTGLRPPIARYVALGESFASGTGIQQYDVPGPQKCRRSSLSYPYLIDGMRLPNGTQIKSVSRACHGADLEDMYIANFDAYPESSQTHYLSRQATRMVTVSIGGNDLGFADRLTDCMLSDLCGNRGAPLLNPADLRSVQLRLTALYRDILENYLRPDGILVVVNYPALFPPLGQAWTSCLSQGAITPEEVGQIQQAWAEARLMIANAVTAVGNPRVRLVDVYEAFAGHYLCSADPWTTGFLPDFNLGDSFHPNAKGHAAIKNKIVQSLGLRQ